MIAETGSSSRAIELDHIQEEIKEVSAVPEVKEKKKSRNALRKGSEGEEVRAMQTILQKASGARKNSVQEMQKVGKLDTKVNGQSIQPVSSSAQITEMTAVQDHTKRNNTTRKQEVKASVQELASRAAS
ncbi:hypothetical protein CerSpe_091530 [Prunus speciosa]